MSRRRKAQLVALIIVIPVIILGFMVSNTNQKQLERIELVLKNTTEKEMVYDGDAQFNVYRFDLHYFWFSIKNGGLDTYQRIQKKGPDYYDACHMIDLYKPIFISPVRVNLKQCGLLEYYRKTSIKKLYIRKDQLDPFTK